jgi:replicative DNA helicase
MSQQKDYRDTASELKLISYIVRKDFRKCEEITRDIFSIKAYKLFFDIVYGHRTTFPKDVLKDIISDRLKNPDQINPYLIKLYKISIDNVSGKNIESIIEKLKKLANLRISLEKQEDMLTATENGDFEEIRKIAKQISLLGTNRKKIYAGEYLKDFEERKAIIKARRDKPLVGIPTGIKKFDKLTGGVMNGELAIVAGESAIGKSIALENFALHAWDIGMNIGYFTIEMPKHQVQFRADSRNTRLLYQKFRKGEFTDEELIDWEDMIEVYRENKNNFFEIVSLPRGCNSTDIESEAERLQDINGKQINLIIVDYLNIMSTNITNKSNSRDWQSQVDIAWELKEIATDFCGKGVGLWTGNQVTDEAEGKGKIKKSQIKYGRGIVEVANIVVGLTQSQDDLLEDIMRMQIIKMRDASKIEPIIIRPNYDVMMLDDEYLRNKHRSTMKRKRSE